MEEELGAHTVSPVKTKAMFTRQQATQGTTAEESENLRDAIEASHKEWEGSERKKLDQAQARQTTYAELASEMDAMMSRLAPAKNGASGKESAALAGLLSTAVEGAPSNGVAGLMGLLTQPNRPATEKAEKDDVIQP